MSTLNQEITNYLYPNNVTNLFKKKHKLLTIQSQLYNIEVEQNFINIYKFIKQISQRKLQEIFKKSLKMKWQLMTLGLGWGYFLFKLYQQYRQCRKIYHNENILIEDQKPTQQKVMYDAQSKPIFPDAQQLEQMTPNSATQQPKKEGKLQQTSQTNKKSNLNFYQTIDECDFVVFPQLYPHLRKKKQLCKKYTMINSTSQTNKLRIKRKRDTKKFKEWFITNKILSQIQQSGQLTSQQIASNYSKLTKQIKSTVIQGNQTTSNSAKSQEGTNVGNGQIVIKTNTTKKGITQNDKVLGFLQEQQFNDQNNKYKIQKYDPFV